MRSNAHPPPVYLRPIVGYTRVSSEEQVASGAGLAAQEAAIRAYATAAGATLAHLSADEGVSGSTAPTDRPALRQALAIVAAESGLLVVAKLDRLARKASDVLALRDRAEREGWSLAAADGSIDTATPHGRAMTSVMAAFAELERDLIRARTKEALAAVKASGTRLGRPSAMPADILARIVSEREAGRSLPAIAKALAADGVPTVRGGRWQPSTIVRALHTAQLDKLAQSNARNA